MDADRGEPDIEELAAIGIYDLGLTVDAFWGMTPRMFTFLLERRQLTLKQEDRRSGGVMAMLYNLNRDIEKDPKGAEWWDFFTQWRPPPKEQTEEEMLEMMLAFTKSTNEGLSH